MGRSFLAPCYYDQSRLTGAEGPCGWGEQELMTACTLCLNRINPQAAIRPYVDALLFYVIKS